MQGRTKLGIVALSLFLGANAVAPTLGGYQAARDMLQNGYTRDEMEKTFWEEYGKSPLYKKFAAAMLRPGIRLAYLIND